MFSIKKIFSKYKERKLIKQQFNLEKKCIEYFRNSIIKNNNLNDFISDNDGLYLLGKFKKDSFPLQVVKLKHLYDGGKPILSYGDYNYNSEIEWLTSVTNFPKELWINLDDYQRPTCPLLILCKYSSGHYEVVDYSNKTWITELMFPTKPTQYFVLDFLEDNE